MSRNCKMVETALSRAEEHQEMDSKDGVSLKQESVSNLVLVGDDTPSTLYLTSRCLEFDNHAVTTAATGEEIIRKSIELRPSVIVLDLMLPGCSGLNLIRSIKTPMPDTRICVMSVIDDKKTIQKAINLGADDYIIKPVCPEMLAHKVNLLSGRIEGRSEDYSPCDLSIVIKDDANIIYGTIVKASRYMLQAKLSNIPTVNHLYRCRSNSLNKIMERNGDFFVRVTSVDRGIAYLECVGTSEQQSRRLKEFTSRESHFSDSTLFN